MNNGQITPLASSLAMVGTANQRQAKSVVVRRRIRHLVDLELEQPAEFYELYEEKIRDKGYLFQALLYLLGSILVGLVSLYSTTTTQAVIADVKNALYPFLSNFFSLPVSLLESIYIITLPLWLLIRLGAQGRFRQVLETTAIFTLTALLVWLLTLAQNRLPERLLNSFFLTQYWREVTLTIIAHTCIIVVLTTVRHIDPNRLRKMWIYVWVVLLLGTIVGKLTITGMLVIFLNARVVGLILRYFLSGENNSVSALHLTEILLAAEICPRKIIRLKQSGEANKGTNRWNKYLIRNQNCVDQAKILEQVDLGDFIAEETLAKQVNELESTQAKTTFAKNPCDLYTKGVYASICQIYRIYDSKGKSYQLNLLDVTSRKPLSSRDFWDSLRFNGILEALISTRKKQLERIYLNEKIAFEAKLNCLEPLFITNSGNLCARIYRRDLNLVALEQMVESKWWDSLPHEAKLPLEVQLMQRTWQALKSAWKNGLVHRNITTGTVLVDLDYVRALTQMNLLELEEPKTDPKICFDNWEVAVIIDSDFSHSLDAAQMLVYLSLLFSPKTVIDIAIGELSQSRVEQVASLLQKASLPRDICQRIQKLQVSIREQNAKQNRLKDHSHPERNENLLEMIKEIIEEKTTTRAPDRPRKEENLASIKLEAPTETKPAPTASKSSGKLGKLKLSLSKTLLSKTKVQEQNLLESTEPEPGKSRRKLPLALRLVYIAVIFVTLALINTIDFASTLEALKQANYWWVIAGFIVSFFSWLGAAIALTALLQIKIPFLEVFLTQVAASVTLLVAPSILGNSLLNIRMFRRWRVAYSDALVHMTLIQVSQFLTSVFLLLVSIFFTGYVFSSYSNSYASSSTEILLVVIAIAIVFTVLVSIGKIRNYLYNLALSYWRKLYPLILHLLNHPVKILIIFLGNVLMNLSYAGALYFSLLAFSTPVDLATVIVIYLGSSTIGSLIPIPGGVGTVEAVLVACLTAISVPYAAAFSATILFRLFTIYLRVPIGWVALKVVDHL